MNLRQGLDSGYEQGIRALSIQVVPGGCARPVDVARGPVASKVRKVANSLPCWMFIEQTEIVLNGRREEPKRVRWKGHIQNYPHAGAFDVASVQPQSRRT